MTDSELSKIISQLRGVIELELESGISEIYTKTKKTVLEDIRIKVMNCKQCALHKTRQNVVFGEGNSDARLVFVGEAPGEEEDIQGAPFVGAAGELLTKIIQAMGLKRVDVYICNVIKCRPPNNRQPSLDEIDKCKPYLEEQLSLIKPEIICALGRYAIFALTGKDGPLSGIRGHFLDYNGIKLIPTFHPAYLLRNPQAKKFVWQDMKKIMCLLK